jgi:hypothetical protein
MLKIKQWVMTPNFQLMFEAMLPAKRIVCPTCQGYGTAVNPAIDSNGLTWEDLRDPEFRAAYMRGDYDEICYRCNGLNVISELDWEALTPKLQRAVYMAEAQISADEREAAGERRMGA